MKTLKNTVQSLCIQSTSNLTCARHSSAFETSYSASKSFDKRSRIVCISDIEIPTSTVRPHVPSGTRIVIKTRQITRNSSTKNLGGLLKNCECLCVTMTTRHHHLRSFNRLRHALDELFGRLPASLPLYTLNLQL